MIDSAAMLMQNVSAIEGVFEIILSLCASGLRLREREGCIVLLRKLRKAMIRRSWVVCTKKD